MISSVHKLVFNSLLMPSNSEYRTVCQLELVHYGGAHNYTVHALKKMKLSRGMLFQTCICGVALPQTRRILIIIESVDSICRDSADTQYMLIQTNFSKSPKQLTYKPL